MEKCCICLEYENKGACMQCNFCRDGIICVTCMMGFENATDIVRCPVCRSILISYSIRKIVLNALIYEYGISLEYPVSKIFLENYHEIENMNINYFETEK
tara:strand:- start:599 stop:898 length:300 start_codon:yes stop_codon:yes gene_type:complete